MNGKKPSRYFYFPHLFPHFIKSDLKNEVFNEKQQKLMEGKLM